MSSRVILLQNTNVTDCFIKAGIATLSIPEFLIAKQASCNDIFCVWPIFRLLN
jgi:hypothetical protein